MTADAARLLEAVDEVARLGGRIALEYFGRRLDVETKTDGSPVTVADRAVERAVRDWVLDRFPGDSVLGEEYGEVVDSGPRKWLIDPIDGTKSFVRGVPLWGFMVGVAVGGEIVAGAVNCAATGDLVAAAVGCGCWHNGTRASVSKVDDLATATILTTDDRFAANPHRQSRWTELADRCAIVRTWGDCYGYVLVATGRAEAMLDDRLSPWDAAPLIPILGEAGGAFTDWRGQCSLAGTDGIATNAVLGSTVRRALGVPEP